MNLSSKFVAEHKDDKITKGHRHTQTHTHIHTQTHTHIWFLQKG